MNKLALACIAGTALVFAASCASTDSVPEDEVAVDEAMAAVSCDPTMFLFPVAAPHNIGHDDATCADRHCDVSCPDQNANSDYSVKHDHHGIDIFAHLGAPIVAVTDGVVMKEGPFSDTSGIRVRIRDACGWEYYYGHLDQEFVDEKQFVKAGDVIGTMGSTGADSVHLHFNVSPNGSYKPDINPFDLLVRTSPTACGGVVAEPPSNEPPPPPPEGCGVFPAGGVLFADQAFPSCDGRFALVMQGDGNLVLYAEGGRALWSTGTQGTGAAMATIHNGDLEVLNGNLQKVWSTGTYGYPESILAVQDDGNLVVYEPEGKAIWNSQTCCQ